MIANKKGLEVYNKVSDLRQLKMCKTCQIQERDSRRGSSQARMIGFNEDKKKALKGEHKGLPWKQAIQQAAML